eukprot:9239404-Pyramimonas_sp.AAC.2
MPIPLAVTWDEMVISFVQSDVSVSGGFIWNWTEEAPGYSYLFNLNLTEGVPATVWINADVTQDRALNYNAPSNTMVFYLDTTQPTVAITNVTPLIHNEYPMQVTATFSEPVYAFTAADVYVQGGTASQITPADDTVATDFLIDVIPDGEVNITVMINASVTSDEASNLNVESNAVTFWYDSTPPVPAIATTYRYYQKNAPIPVTVFYDEQVYGFTGADVAISGPAGGTVSSFTGWWQNYFFEIAPGGQGVLDVIIPGG